MDDILNTAIAGTAIRSQIFRKPGEKLPGVVARTAGMTFKIYLFNKNLCRDDTQFPPNQFLSNRQKLPFANIADSFVFLKIDNRYLDRKTADKFFFGAFGFARMFTDNLGLWCVFVGKNLSFIENCQ